MVQHVGGMQSYSDVIGGPLVTTNKHYVALPELSQAGNALILTYRMAPATGIGSISIGDDQTNTWTQAVAASNGTLNQSMVFVWYALNIKANTRQAWVTNTTGQNCSGIGVMDFSEWANIAAVSALDKTSTNFGLASSVTAGSMTPTVTNDLLYQAVLRRGGGPESSITTAMWTPGSQTDISWELLTADGQDGNCVQAGVYTNTTAINPTLTMRSTTNYICAAVALKASLTNQGSARTTLTPQIVSILHQGQDNVAYPLTNVLQFPTKGNFQVLMMAGGSTNWNTTNIVSSVGNVYQQVPGGPFHQGSQDSTQVWFCTNSTPSATEQLTMYYFGTSPGHWSWLKYDIANASTWSYDAKSSIVGDQAVALSAQMTLTNTIITPRTNNGMVFFCAQWEFNTAVGADSPAGSIFDAETWDGMPLSGPEAIDQNGGWAHYRVSSMGSYTNVWRYQATNALRQYSTLAVAFNNGTNQPLGSGIQYVQSTSVDGGSVQNGTLQYVSPVTAGSLLVVAIRQGSGSSGNLCTVTNTQGDIFTECATKGSGDGHTNRIFYAKNATGGTGKVGVNFSLGAASLRWSIHEYSGLSTTAPLDQTAVNNGTGTAADSGNVTTTTANELLFGFCTVDNTATFTAGTSFTIRETVASKFGSEDQTVAATGTYSGSETLGTSGPWTMTFATFK